MPKDLSGPGFHNLKLLNMALRAKWVWISKMDREKAWAAMDLAATLDAITLFNASVNITVGDVASLLF
jgi:hypothetical protein